MRRDEEAVGDLKAFVLPRPVVGRAIDRDNIDQSDQPSLTPIGDKIQMAT